MQAYEKLNGYINFKDKAEFNEHLTAHRQAHCYKLNETDKKLLTYLSRYAIRYTGAAYLKVKTMAKMIGKDSSTVKRIIRKLEELGILKRFSNKREKLGGYGANIIQFQRYEANNDLSQVNGRPAENNAEIPCESKAAGIIVETKPIISSKLKSLKNNTYPDAFSEGQDNVKVSKDFKDMTLYERIKYLVSMTTDNPDDLKEYCKVVYGNIKRLLKFDSFKPYEADIEALAYESVKTAIYAKNVRTTRPAFLHGVLNHKIEQFKTDLAEMEESITDEIISVPGQITYNWLENY